MRSLALLAIAFLTALARPQTNADVDRVVLEHMQRTKTPGCSVAIVAAGKVILAKGYGLANVETDAPATPETVYRIGSLTKSFTAALVMAHVEKGELGLDDPIRMHLPDLPDAFEKVTVRQLLNHTSGIASYTDLPEFVSIASRPGSAKEMIEMSAKAKPNFAPGEGWKYNNTGYIVLGELAAKLEGKPWAEAIQERIARPLGMTATQASDPTKIVKNRAMGYEPGPTGVKNATVIDMSWPYSAGVLESTVLDLAKFESALGAQLLKPETFAAMTTPSGASKSYGFGWAVSQTAGLTVHSHNGGIPGFMSYLARVPAKKTTVIVLTNSSAGRADALGRQILGLAVPELAVKPSAVADDDPEMTKFLRGKLERLLSGELKTDELTPEFAKVLNTEMIGDVKKTLGTLGPIGKFELIESTKVDGKVARSYVVDLGGNAFTITFGVSPDKKIAGLTIKG